MKTNCTHPTEPAGYLEWHDWAEEQDRKGIEQKQCPVCKKWFFEQDKTEIK